MVCCRDATASSFVSKVQGEFFAHFHAVTVKVTVVCGINCLICQGEFFVNNPIDIKENDDHAIDFTLHLFSPVSVSLSLGFPCAANAFLPERLSNNFQGLWQSFSEICTKCDAASLSNPS
jgi:hypothetical protein